MKIRKVVHTTTSPSQLELIRGSGAVIATISVDTSVMLSGRLYPEEIEQVLYLMKNFNLVFDSL